MAASPTHNFPPEIIEAILRLLPPKSLGRFKSVSKPWNSLISNPQFLKSHLHHHPHKSPKLILLSDTKSLYSLHITVPYPDTGDIPATSKQLNFRSSPIRWEEILGSCNGLLLAKDEIDTIFLINPTTQRLCKLPPSPFALPDHESFVMYGFGYDSSTDDYKVISISFWDTDNEHNPDCTDMYMSVYSSRNNSWRKLPNSPYDHAVGHLTSGVLVNQNLHWLTSTRPGYSSALVAFSLANEEFKEIELPDAIRKDKAVFNELVVVGGKLGVFGSLLGGDLWVMEEYGVGASWTRVCMHGVEIDPVKPVCFIEGRNGNRNRDRDIVLGDEDTVFMYSVDERRCRNVRIVGGPRGFGVGGMYFESLESPECN